MLPDERQVSRVEILRRENQSREARDTGATGNAENEKRSAPAGAGVGRQRRSDDIREESAYQRAQHWHQEDRPEKRRQRGLHEAMKPPHIIKGAQAHGDAGPGGSPGDTVSADQ